jgi:plasmid stability protein
MGQVLVRNLDDAGTERLERQALEQRTSPEPAARDALTAAVTAAFDRAAWAARAQATRAQTRPGDDASLVEPISDVRDDDRLTQMLDERAAAKRQRGRT